MPCLRNGVVSLQVDFLVLHAFPKPFDEDIIDPAALAIHAHLDATALDQADELLAGERAALVGVEMRIKSFQQAVQMVVTQSNGIL